MAVDTQGQLILAKGKFDPQEKMKAISSFIGFGLGAIGYITIHGQKTNSYALFGCKEWKHLTGKQQTYILEKEIGILSLELPLMSEEDNNE